MLNVYASPTAYQTLHAGDVAFGICSCLYATASCIVNVWLVDVNQIPVRSAYIAALVLQCALTQYYADRVLTKLLIVGQRILNLPLSAVALLGRCLSVVTVVVTREVVLGECTLLMSRRRDCRQ